MGEVRKLREQPVTNGGERRTAADGSACLGRDGVLADPEGAAATRQQPAASSQQQPAARRASVLR